MKYFAFLFFCVMILLSCKTTQKVNYAATVTGNEKVLDGIINRAVIEADSAFPWLARDMKYIYPSAEAVTVFQEKKNKFSLVVFAGTWCEDSQNLLPKFYKLIVKSGYPENKILLVGVDRNKQTTTKLHTQYNITKVPTFIVMQGKTEVARIVEYGKYNDIEKELAEIVSKL